MHPVILQEETRVNGEILRGILHPKKEQDILLDLKIPLNFYQISFTSFKDRDAPELGSGQLVLAGTGTF